MAIVCVLSFLTYDADVVGATLRIADIKDILTVAKTRSLRGCAEMYTSRLTPYLHSARISCGQYTNVYLGASHEQPHSAASILTLRSDTSTPCCHFAM